MQEHIHDRISRNVSQALSSLWQCCQDLDHLPTFCQKYYSGMWIYWYSRTHLRVSMNGEWFFLADLFFFFASFHFIVSFYPVDVKNCTIDTQTDENIWCYWWKGICIQNNLYKFLKLWKWLSVDGSSPFS